MFKRKPDPAQLRLDQYRVTLGSYQRWLAEFPDIAHVLATLEATAEGRVPLNAGTPSQMEFCTVDGLREQIRRMRAGTERA